MIQKAFIFMFLCLFIALPAGFLYGTLTAKDTKDPVALSDKVTIELIATMEDGKVRVYRIMDFEVPGFLPRTCHITVGELHGKTVTMDCIG